MKTASKATLERLRIGDLKPHPDQATFFGQFGEFEYPQLRADIVTNGLKTPIEVLPPDNAAGLPRYTILSGHTRLKILSEIGETTSEVRVRHDLKGASRTEIDRLFLLENLARRRLDRLGQARAAQRLFEIEKGRKSKSKVGHPSKNGGMRERIGAILGVSGRNLDRHFQVLKTPPEVQRAFEQNQLRLVDASRIASLPEGDQTKLASRLRAGESPRVVLASFFKPKAAPIAKADAQLAAFARVLEAAHAGLADRVGEVKVRSVRTHEATFRKTRKLLRVFLAKLDPGDE